VKGQGQQLVSLSMATVARVSAEAAVLSRDQRTAVDHWKSLTRARAATHHRYDPSTSRRESARAAAGVDGMIRINP